MTTLLIKNADVLVTMDEQRREIAKGGLFCRDGVIEQVGASEELPQEADKVLDMTGQVVLPGFINTHHHMFQSLTRAVPAAQDCELFGWLKTLYPIWKNITPPMIRTSAKIAMAELILSGCTTSSDHLYLYPNGSKLEDSIESALEIGMRFHATRGSMSVGESKGGLPPDVLTQSESVILKDCQRVIEHFHDANPYAMIQIALAPCSPFSVSEDLMKETVKMARHYKVSMHTHLAENTHDLLYSKEKFNKTPTEYVQSLDWVGPDVWHAHCVQLDQAGIALFSKTCTGVAHCPSSNMRLASGIAPVRNMLDAGVPVGLGVDGSASNDGGHLLNEARQAMLLARAGSQDPAILTARSVLEMATIKGAQVLGRSNIGRLEAKCVADFVGFSTEKLNYAGAHADLVAALIFCSPSEVKTSVINGKQVVSEGRLLTLDLGKTIQEHNTMSASLLRG